MVGTNHRGRSLFEIKNIMFLEKYPTFVDYTIRNCVDRNHIILELKVKNNSYIIIMQLPPWKYGVLINILPSQRTN